jgi:hypothetical protein
MKELYARNPVLAITGWLHWGLAASLLVAMPFDSRTILGISPEIKPLKFAISIAIFVWTLAWYLYYVRDRRRAVSTISWGVSICMVTEIVCITLQSVRGVTSHYNIATPFDAAIFSTMGGTIGINTLLLMWVVALFLVENPRIPRGYLLGIRFGLIIFVLASFEGVIMILHGSHTVGAIDGGQGLPFVNWSREHGDLRVAHFAGMHALQILPLAGYWMSKRDDSRSVRPMLGLGLGYLAVIVLLFWVAWKGRPILSL